MDTTIEYNREAGCIILPVNGRMIADLGFVGVDQEYWGKRIVHCVNNFDELLEACEILVPFLKNSAYKPNIEKGEELEQAIEKAKKNANS